MLDRETPFARRLTTVAHCARVALRRCCQAVRKRCGQQGQVVGDSLLRAWPLKGLF